MPTAPPPSVTFVYEDDKGNREEAQLPGPGGEINIAAGRPGRRSGVWKIKANKNKSDIYVGARPTFGIQKVSLHELGDWRVQWVNTNPVGRHMVEQTGSRIQDQWRKPAEMAPGWTRGLSIWIPDGEIVGISDDYQTEDKAVWVPPPAPGLALGFHVAGARTDNGFTQVRGALPLPASPSRAAR